MDKYKSFINAAKQSWEEFNQGSNYIQKQKKNMDEKAAALIEKNKNLGNQKVN